ncbi:hypothetical protein [Plesiocystis pacifica]|uniref:hypothetical protein n=1 Tax=Plesiocystis pacifica TaxID=191768 RepID=UPI0012FC8A8C|nr:hypothetical protein [Plesiocystis pacifica]
MACLLLPATAHAGKKRSKPKRRGGQAEVLAGASACLPGPGDCKDDSLGKTAPSVGMAFDIGYRAHPGFFIGAGYQVGWFNPTWSLEDDQPEFSNAYQQGIFGVLRGYWSLWRFDIGFELAPGWSRQTFVRSEGDTRHYSQGFALRPGLSLDIFVSRHVFLGAKADVIFNLHRQICERTGNDTICEGGLDIRQARVHQLIGGVHVGGVF